MAKVCPVTHKKVMSGNNVSHANNKTKRKFNINMQHVSFMSEKLGRSVQLRLTTNGMRTIEFHGGLDAFLLKSPTRKLSHEMRSLQKVIKAKA